MYMCVCKCEVRKVESQKLRVQNQIRKTAGKSAGLTSHDKADRLAAAASLRVGRLAGVIAGGGARHALQDEALIAEDHAGRDIVVDFVTLHQGESKNTIYF